ncbi:MAG: hypothetical protein WCF85_12735 [Rhodospirillaceae bacterium]
MSSEKRRVPTGLTVRTIVLVGIWGLLLVLIGAMTNTIGTPFFVGMTVLFASLIGAIPIMRALDRTKDSDEP